MSVKNVSKAYALETARTLASNFTTDAYSVEYLDNVGICIKCSSVTDNTGTFTIQGSVDGVTFVEITVSPVMVLADASQNFLINLNQMPFKELKVDFVAAGGTPDGTCDIAIMAKRI